MTDYFSDRERGPKARAHETLSSGIWGGIVIAIERRIVNGAFGVSFPEECGDGQGVAGTSAHAMGLGVLAEVPELSEAVAVKESRWDSSEFAGWPLRADLLPPTLGILDVIEFCFRHVAQPIEVSYHSYYRHSHLRFDTAAGRRDWLSEINTLFARNGMAYELRAHRGFD